MKLSVLEGLQNGVNIGNVATVSALVRENVFASSAFGDVAGPAIARRSFLRLLAAPGL